MYPAHFNEWQRHAMFITCRHVVIICNVLWPFPRLHRNTFRWPAGCWSIDEQFDNTSMSWACMGSWGIFQIACPGWKKKWKPSHMQMLVSVFGFISKSHVAPFGFLRFKRTENLTTLDSDQGWIEQENLLNCQLPRLYLFYYLPRTHPVIPYARLRRWECFALKAGPWNQRHICKSRCLGG